MSNYASGVIPRNQLEEFFTRITGCFPRRAESMSAIAGALLTYPGPVDCVAHLSLVTPGYTHWGLYEALKRGKVDPVKLTAVLTREATQDDWFENIYSVDVTSWHLPESYSTPDRVMAYAPRAFRYGGPAAIPGFKYQIVAAQAHKTGSWARPVSILRVAPGGSVNLLAYGQMQEIMKTAPDGALFVFDSGYSGHYLTYLARRDQMPAEILVRLEGNRVFYERAPVRSPTASGHPRWHGARFPVKTPARPADYSVGFKDHKYGRMTAEAYYSLHTKLFHHHAGMKQVIEDEGELPIVEGTVIHVTSDMGADMWYWYSGDPSIMNLRDLFYSYAHRYDIEHMFRFMKQTLGFTSFHPGGTRQADNWAWLQACTVALLASGRKLITDMPHRGETVRKPIQVTAGRVRRGITQHVSRSIEHLGVALKKTSGRGAVPKISGGVRKPREQHAVHVTGKLHHARLQPNRDKQQALRKEQQALKKKARLEKALKSKGLQPPKN